MNTTDPASLIANNRDEHRYEVKMDEQLAILTYKQQAGRIVFLHTGVPPALQGLGIASQLASFALEEARAQHLTVVPLCPFVASYIRRHREYLPLLTEAEQARLLEN
jgi:predicted GNAT family acetyltransferase